MLIPVRIASRSNATRSMSFGMLSRRAFSASSSNKEGTRLTESRPKSANFWHNSTGEGKSRNGMSCSFATSAQTSAKRAGSLATSRNFRRPMNGPQSLAKRSTSNAWQRNCRPRRSKSLTLRVVLSSGTCAISRNNPASSCSKKSTKSFDLPVTLRRNVLSAIAIAVFNGGEAASSATEAFGGWEQRSQPPAARWKDVMYARTISGVLMILESDHINAP
mmetsp:Transcript_119667/g.338790  ORF Transcript_119667/g.338790 Transcript_119667/m.338790 type:complete len:219 (-) Transcript_119667:983-1639(-)